MRFNYIKIPLLFLALFSCDDENVQQNVIPNVRFPTKVLYLNNPSMSKMRVPGTAIFINDIGYNGVWLYRFDQKTFYAYDGNCPHTLKSDCSRLSLETLQLNCGCDEAKFSLINGSSLNQNMTKIPLKPYRVVFSERLNTVNISSF